MMTQPPLYKKRANQLPYGTRIGSLEVGKREVVSENYYVHLPPGWFWRKYRDYTEGLLWFHSQFHIENYDKGFVRIAFGISR